MPFAKMGKLYKGKLAKEQVYGGKIRSSVLTM